MSTLIPVGVGEFPVLARDLHKASIVRPRRAYRLTSGDEVVVTTVTKEMIFADFFRGES